MKSSFPIFISLIWIFGCICMVHGKENSCLESCFYSSCLQYSLCQNSSKSTNRQVFCCSQVRPVRCNNEDWDKKCLPQLWCLMKLLTCLSLSMFCFVSMNIWQIKISSKQKETKTESQMMFCLSWHVPFLPSKVTVARDIKRKAQIPFQPIGEES